MTDPGDSGLVYQKFLGALYSLATHHGRYVRNIESKQLFEEKLRRAIISGNALSDDYLTENRDSKGLLKKEIFNDVTYDCRKYDLLQQKGGLISLTSDGVPVAKECYEKIYRN